MPIGAVHAEMGRLESAANRPKRRDLNVRCWHETEVRALRSVDPFSDALPTFSLYRLMNCSVEVRGVLMIDQHYGQVKTMQAAGMLTRLAKS